MGESVADGGLMFAVDMAFEGAGGFSEGLT